MKKIETGEELGAALVAVAVEIEGRRIARGLSGVKLLRLYPALGSTKTFSRLCAGQTDGLKLEDWLAKYRGVLAAMQAAAVSTDETFDDLGTAYAAITTARQLMTMVQTDLPRLVIIEGESGAGKSRALEAVKAANPGTAVIVDADEAWKTKKAMVTSLLAGIGEADNVEAVSGDFMTRQARLISALRDRRLLVMIDESQHLTAEGLTVLKTLINRTPSWFFIAGQSTLWKKLKANAWQEAKQLIYNRCFALLTFGAPEVEDVMVFLSRRLGLADGFAEGTWKKLAAMAGSCGGFAFLRDTADAARHLIASGEAVGDEEILSAAEQIKRRAVSR